MNQRLLYRWSHLCLLLRLTSWLSSLIWDGGFSSWIIGHGFGSELLVLC
jgi:hypothetical protein